ncbi:hypothetical protein D3C87_1821030 [compost metagenome]
MVQCGRVPAPDNDEVEKADGDGQRQLRTQPWMIGNHGRHACRKDWNGDADDAHVKRHMRGKTVGHEAR